MNESSTRSERLGCLPHLSADGDRIETYCPGSREVHPLIAKISPAYMGHEIADKQRYAEEIALRCNEYESLIQFVKEVSIQLSSTQARTNPAILNHLELEAQRLLGGK